MAALLFSKQATTMSSRLTKLSSSFNQTLTLFTDYTSRRSRAVTLIPAPKIIRKFCCTGRHEEVTPIEEEDPGHSGFSEDNSTSEKRPLKYYGDLVADETLRTPYPYHYPWGNHGPFHYSKGDLASEDSMWILYQRWCLHFHVKRNLVEQRWRFNFFKEDLLEVDRINREAGDVKCLLNEFSDMSPEDNAVAIKCASDMSTCPLEAYPWEEH